MIGTLAGRRPSDRPDPLTDLYAAQYRRLLGLAGRFLGDDADQREDVVQEAYLRVRLGWDRVDPDKAPAYLRQTVANLARSAVRRRVAADRSRRALAAAPAASAEDHALARLLGDGVAAALRALPSRQREAVLLRHYVGLSQADAARSMGCSPGSVKAYTSRGLAALTLATRVRAGAARGEAA